ncbi:MAG: UDP-N-acetylglucosamine 2-epimerase (non-hydrolyzing) [Bacteroidota bacterium]|nr:UDP-N-acetylglucosamine 2-epimerase (non-hydrolyzing) [Bacteroidota bacterium]
MIHIFTVIGARPQIIKAAALSRAIREKFSDKIMETIVHTGQHYDENMSQVFFDELEIPVPKINLQINSGTRQEQMPEMADALENLFREEKPNAILVYGDTTSTYAGAEAGARNNIPVVHIEAGMRSFNNEMPEEFNRIYCDNIATLLFSPTKTGVENLANENITSGVYHCGDVMYDNSLYFAEIAEQKAASLFSEKVNPGNYFLATVHRDFNTDKPERLSDIFKTFEKIAEEHKMPVVIPLHPRTKKQLALLPELEQKIYASAHLLMLPPVSFLEMILLEKNARLILTDSGGVQKEAFYFKKPCVILRPETEWVELVECGAAILADTDPRKIQQAVRTLLQANISYPEIFGDGNAAEFICSTMISELAPR